MKLSDDLLFIRGGHPLRGDIAVNTAKNSALVLMLGALLTKEPVVLRDIPRLSDVRVMLEMLGHFGARTRWDAGDLHIHAAEMVSCEAPYTLVSKMRASFVALGALLGRCGSARISMPGGCALGPRPVDRHIKAFKQLGAEVGELSGDFYVYRRAPLFGRVAFEAPTVGGTQNVVLASTLGTGRVVIENAATEPEVTDLVAMLRAMGADITGAGTSRLEIQGVPQLHGVTYRPIPDRIEAGTLMLAAAATRGRVRLRGVEPEHLRAVTAKLRETGVKVTSSGRSLSVDATEPPRPADVTATPYPGLPTDLQAPFGAYLATVPGVSLITDEVFPDRTGHVPELARMGARLELKERTLVVRGTALRGAQVHASDIRAGGALIVAALAAEGESAISGVEYIRRGYAALPERLRTLGADIRRVKAAELATGTYGD